VVEKQSSLMLVPRRKATVTRGTGTLDVITYSACRRAHLLTGLWQLALAFPDIYRQSKVPGTYEMPPRRHIYSPATLHTACRHHDRHVKNQCALQNYIALNLLSTKSNCTNNEFKMPLAMTAISPQSVHLFPNRQHNNTLTMCKKVMEI